MEGNDATVNQSSGEREPSTMSHGNLTYKDPEVDIGQQLKDSTTGKLLAMTEMLSSYQRQAARDELEDPRASEEEDNALSRLEYQGSHVQESTASTPRSEQGRSRHGTSKGLALSLASSNRMQLPRLTLRQGGGQPLRWRTLLQQRRSQCAHLIWRSPCPGPRYQGKVSHSVHYWVRLHPC
jgi:hypothetical protein